jgi:hypothetical protein
MNKSSCYRYLTLVISLLVLIIFLSGCLKTEESGPLIPYGTFPDSALNMVGINSPYDDYNISLHQLTGSSPILFSSNRGSEGGQFDLVQADISFIFDQTSGNFNLSAEMSEDAFLSALTFRANTPRNDFGPYRLYSSIDGYEYLLLSSVNANGNLDLFYLKNLPFNNYTIPEIQGPSPVKILNSDYDDAYICFDSNLDSAYFISNQSGNFDIYVHPKPVDENLTTWFNQAYSPSVKVDNINSSSDDKCPIIFQKIMIFSSNRPGGYGGFDLYYSMFKNGNWNTPVNLGPKINSASDEYRPVVGYHPQFTNLFLMFSSNRPGGKGGFDLYFTGFEFPQK